MNKDDVIRFYEQSFLEVNDENEIPCKIFSRFTFAKLVAEHEREACAKVCDDIDKSHWGCEVKATWCSQAIRARGQA